MTVCVSGNWPTYKSRVLQVRALSRLDMVAHVGLTCGKIRSIGFSTTIVRPDQVRGALFVLYVTLTEAYLKAGVCLSGVE